MSPMLSAWVSPAGPSSSCRSNGARKLAAPEPTSWSSSFFLSASSSYFFTADKRAFGKRNSPPRDARVSPPADLFGFFLPAHGGPPSWPSLYSSMWQPSSWPTTHTGVALAARAVGLLPSRHHQRVVQQWWSIDRTRRAAAAIILTDRGRELFHPPHLSLCGA